MIKEGACGVRRKFSLGIVLLLCSTVLWVTGCRKNPGKGPEASGKPAVTEQASPDATEDSEVPAVNIDALEELQGITLTANDRAHNLYRGMSGDEEALLSLWIDKEAQEAQISIIGAYHSDKLQFQCELLEDGIRYQDDNYYILLKQKKDDTLKGYFYEKGSGLTDIDLKLEAINYGMDKDHLYCIGDNETVEAFAQKVLDSINGCDFKAFSKYVSFPVTVHVNQAIQTIETKEDFLALGDEVIFTDGFVASMAVAYPNLMFCNMTDGAMLGDGQYNIWINTDKNGELKVVSINN